MRPTGDRTSAPGAERIDAFDAKLLDLVQSNNRMTSEELGNAVGLSATACQRRLARLRASGVIEADVAIVNPAACGRHHTMVVLVKLERQRLDIVNRFKRMLKADVNVMSATYTTGEFDFALMVSATTIAEFDDFLNKRFHSDPEVKSVTTFVVIDRIKTGHFVPASAQDSR